MSVIENLAAQLKEHGITSLANIEQDAPTELSEHCLKEVSGGLMDGDFYLNNSDGSGTFIKNNP